MAAFYAARYKGIGQHVDVSIMEGHLDSIENKAQYLLGYQYHGMTYTREATGRFGILPFKAVQCKDGWVECGLTPAYWPRFAQMLGRPDLVEGIPNIYDRERLDELEAVYIPWMLERGKQEITETAQAAGVFITPTNTPKEVVEDSHFNERGFFVEIDHPVTGKLKYPGPAFRPEKSPWQLRRPAPLLGQHNEEVCGALGYTREDLVKLRERGVI